MLGGVDKLITQLQKGMKNMKKQGIGFESIEVKDPIQIVKAGKELHIVIPTKSIMKIKKQRLLVKSYLIGISTTQGKTWTFIDGGQLTLEKLKKILHNYNPKLKLPARIPPKKL